MSGDREAFFDLSLDLLCIADRTGTFVDVNRAWTATLGWSAAELRSRPYVDFVHPQDRARTAKETSKLASGIRSIRFENRYLHRDGSWHVLQWMADYRAERGLIYAVARDITKERAALASLQQRIQELEKLDSDLAKARRVPVEAPVEVSQRIATLRARLSAIQADLAP